MVTLIGDFITFLK